MATHLKLGNVQTSVLRSLAREPYPGGWYWVNRSTTIRVLESLVKHGLARKTRLHLDSMRGYSVYEAAKAQRSYDSYEITAAGREVVKETWPRI